MPIDEIAPGEPADIAGRLGGRFEHVHGRAPDGCFAAPGRVNLIGEHVDYNGGRCLPIALPHATYAAMGSRDDDRVTITSLQRDDSFEGTLDTLGPGQVEGWATYVAGVLWALREAGRDVPGLDIVVDSRVPVGAGLSSSAALECSVAVGACELLGVDVTAEVRRDLVDACIRAEAEVAGAPTGGMDQTIALLGEAGHALLLDCRDWSTSQLPWEPSTARLTLLVVDTRTAHQLSDGGYAARRADCEQAAGVLGVDTLRDVRDQAAALARLSDERIRRRARHVFSEMARVDEAVEALQHQDFPKLGKCFDGSHDSLRDDFEVSCPELDIVVDVSRDCGALGARMTGGGFGGSAIALLPDDRVEATEKAVVAAFAERGWAAPGFLVAPASGGARRVR